MDQHRKLWNERHQQLTRALSKGDRDTSLELFLKQHAMVHSATVARSHLWSFEDELLQDMVEEEIRKIPNGGEHSIAWLLFHLARIEDMTMNMLVAGSEQLFTRAEWAKKLNVSILHSANRMSYAQVAKLSAQINLKPLLDYRAAVAKRTRQIVMKLQTKDFKQKVEPARIEQVLEAGAVTPEAIEIAHYWGNKTIAGLLLMPPTRHCILHLNEAMRIKQKIRK